MSVHDEARLPWLASEKRLIAGALEAGLRVLGVCLGAQLIADVSGARVYRNRFKEIGWFGVEATRDGASHPRYALPRAFRAFHWHGDTFQLPAGAVHLARTEACEQQMFAIGERVLATQFHLEATAESIADMVAHAGDGWTEGPFVQARERLAGAAADVEASHRLLERLLDRWMEGEET
jgi:GMP synthase-like glutamine amidotransferase